MEPEMRPSVGLTTRPVGRASYQVELPVFTGPLDLLLQLVEKEKVSIYDIPIARITEQYLASIERMRDMDLDLASDFLVLAATLMYIKARELVPRPGPTAEPEPGDESGLWPDDSADADPRRELIRRLVEYKEIKEHAAELASLLEASAGLYPSGRRHAMALRQPPLREARYEGTSDGIADPATLWEAYRRVATRETSRPQPYVAAAETLSVVKRMREVLGHLWREGAVTIERLVASRKSRSFLIVTFLAILELFRRGRVWIEQDGLFGRIHVGLRATGNGGKGKGEPEK